MIEYRVSRVEGRNLALGLRACADSHPSTLDSRRSRPGLTLVELLITMMIISILAAAVLGVAAVAGQTAREARTRNIIARLHTLLAEQYDSYKSRRVKVRPEVLQAIDQLSGFSTQQKNQRKALARLYAMRELMLMEMPQRWSDLTLHSDQVPTTPSSYGTSFLKHPVFLQTPSGRATQAGRPELTTVYLRHFDRICNSTNKLTGLPNNRDQILANQGAECLYLIIMNACADGEARSLFQENVIGDTDGDGALEFLDGWGRPIEFLRWAPGFNSEIQVNANLLDTYPEVVGTSNSQEWQEAAARDHDPFDVQRVELGAFRLVPLIVSAGADETFGVSFGGEGSDSMVWEGLNSATLVNLKTLSPYIRPMSGDYAGTATDTAAAADNIHNHLISTRAR